MFKTEEDTDSLIVARHRQFILNAESLGLMVRTAWLHRPTVERTHFEVSMEYLEPAEAWDALALAVEYQADPETEALLIEGLLYFPWVTAAAP